MILNFLNILLFISSISCLRWTSSNDPTVIESPILLSMTAGIFSVDIYKGDQIILDRDIHKKSINNEFRINCMVAGYGPKSELVYKFCREQVCSDDWKESDLTVEFSISNFKITRLPNPPEKKGLMLRLPFPDGNVDISGNFHCEARDNFGKFMIRSNDIQIRDTLFWSHNYVITAENLKTRYQDAVKRDTNPVTFKCLKNGLTLNQQIPIWFKQLSISPVGWSVCPVKSNYQSLTVKEKMTYQTCSTFTTQRYEGSDEAIKPRSLSEMDKWSQYVDNNGDLHIIQIKPESTAPTLTYALMCYIKSNIQQARPINTYIKSDNEDDISSGVEFVGQPTTFSNKLAAYSPQVQNVSLYSRKMIKDTTPRPVALLAMYRASSSATYYWKLNGQQLNQRNQMKTNEYSVQFTGDITSDDAGTYTLDITDGADKLTMTIYVVVLGPPTLDKTDCLPLISYVHEFDSAVFTCKYRNRPQSLTLKINTEEIALAQTLDISRVNLGKSYPFLGELNFTVSPTSYTSSEMVEMSYSVFNLRMTQGQVLYQDHTVMFFVKNDYGLSVRSTSIYVVPRLKNAIESSPETYNCTTSCTSLVEHKFQCKIQLEKYNNRELIIEHYWTINNNNLTDKKDPTNLFAKYFTVDPITKELTLHIIKSNDTEQDKKVKEALKDNNIECHFNLRSPPEVTPPFVYLSTSDESLKTMMKARITLDFQPINTANIYWIIAVILAIIIILLMIILLTRYCMRNKGETYQLDKIERQHGYDPEKEVQEEMFKPYEREEHDPDVMSGDTGDRKLSITGHSVGSADDGELDTYDLDPSNFNEDGSIIGKYGANPRSRAAMT